MSQFKLRVFVLALVFVAITHHCQNTVTAQGRLSKVRNNVRRHQAPPKNDSHGDDDHDHDNDHGHRERRGQRHRAPRHRGHNNGFHPGFANWFDDCHHPQIVEHVHVYESVPQTIIVPVQSEAVVPVFSEAQTYDEDLFVPTFESYFSSWTGRITAFYGANFDDLSHGSLAALFQSPGFLGLDTSVSMFRENGTNFRDHLWVGDVNIVYEAINTSDFRARLGVGINWLGDYYGGDAGANLTFGVDWQIDPKWVLTGETDFGSLGDTDLFHAQLSIGRQFDRAEWTTGYNHYDIGGEAIGGLFTGLRFRF